MEALLEKKLSTLPFRRMKELTVGPSWIVTGNVEVVDYESISALIDKFVLRSVTNYELMEWIYSKAKVNMLREGKCEIVVHASAFEHNKGVGLMFALVDKPAKTKTQLGFSMLEQYRKWR